jgi:hypothetical protein
MTIAVRLWESQGVMVCRLLIPLRPELGGHIEIVAKLDSVHVIEALHRRGIRPGSAEVGSLFGSIGKAVKKISKLSVLKKAMALGKALVNSPLTNLLAPGVATAIKGAAGAAKLIAASKGSDPNKAKKAKLALAAAQAQAKVEDQARKPLPLPASVQRQPPEHQAAFRYLVTVNRNQ